MTQPPGSPESFEKAIAELERIVDEMEGGTISLEQGLDRYQRGISLLRYCRNALTMAEQRILRLEGDALVEADTDDTAR